ncbi:hypothetical protein BD779DRAFT_1572915 [Infundibulicybe gibba]|nr:hypothetical protein BD779DRAFT_1572915 [Infundibulicybe gibba]
MERIHCLSLISILALLAPVKGAPTGLFAPHHHGDRRDASSSGNAPAWKQNGLDAQKLNAQYLTMKATDACQDGQMACINSSFAQCVAGKWVLTPARTGPCVLPSRFRFAAVGLQGGMSGNNQTAAAAGNEPKASDDDAECDDGDDADDEQCDADEGDDDLPDCDDEDATDVTTTTVFVTAAPASASSAPQSAVTTTVFITVALPRPRAPTTVSLTAASLARRQTGPLFSSVPLGSISSSVPGSVAASSAPVSVPLASSAPASVPLASSAPVSVPVSSPALVSVPLPSASVFASSSVTAPASAITSSPVQQNPTGIVIGADGLATATVTMVSISTVTLFTGCAAAPSNTILPSLVSSSAVIPTLSGVVTAPASSISVQATALPSSAPDALSQPVAGIRSSAAAPTVTLTPAGASSSAAPTAAGIVFSFQSAALAPTQSAGDIGQQLTATM